MLVLTLGDPHSVNIEILRRLLAQDRVLADVAQRYAVFFCGSNWHWRDQERRSGLEAYRFETVLMQGAPLPGSGIHFLDLPDIDAEIPAETLTPLQRGRVAKAALEAAAALTPKPDSSPFAVVTGPIDKHACNAAGFHFPGQTEFFEQVFAGDAVMLLAGEKLRVGLVTNHLALSQVPAAVTRPLVVRKGTQLARTLREVCGIEHPRIAVCGLNPHAGDNGLFGDQESGIIAPAVSELRASGAGEFSGPYPADTVFYRALQGRFDAVLAMYHDQGLGPLKTIHFDDGVNISGGLKHLRVSPDHGPAKDLFLTGEASAASFAAALATAGRYLSR